MKTKCYLIFLFVTIFNFSLFGQRVNWIFSVEANTIKFDIQNDLGIGQIYGVISESNPNSVRQEFFDIYREAKSDLGLSFGINSRIKITNQYYFLTGVKMVQYKMKRSEWIVNNSLPNSVFAPPFIPSLGYKSIFIQDLSGAQGVYSKDSPLVFDQELILLKVPLNLGFMTKSERFSFHGGMWYAQVLDGKFGNIEEAIYQEDSFFSNNLVGYNLSLNLLLFKSFQVTFNTTVSPISNIYAERYTNNFGRILAFPSGKNIKTFSFGIAYIL